MYYQLITSIIRSKQQKSDCVDFYLFYFIVDMISVRTFLSQKYKTGDICQGLQQ